MIEMGAGGEGGLLLSGTASAPPMLRGSYNIRGRGDQPLRGRGQCCRTASPGGLGWTDALTPNAVLQIEVLLPPIVHHVPLKAVERWVGSSSQGPREALAKTLKEPVRLTCSRP